MRRISERAPGFTLIEMLVVITITGILVAIVALFIRRPMEGVIASTNRLALADEADNALRRFARDIRLALPNSLRVNQSGGSWYIEFLPVLAGGRYCVEADCGALPLDTVNGNAALSFVGPAPSLSSIPSGAGVVIYNLGVSGLDAYAGGNVATLASIGSDRVVFGATKLFSYASPGSRFQIIGGPVSYVCTPGGKLSRVWNYSRQASQPLAVPSGASTASLADDVSACAVDYQQTAIDQNGLLVMTLGLTRSQNTVTFSHAIQIDNTP